MGANKVNIFEELYREHFVKVYRLALGLVRNPSDAEEITQEAFLRAFRAYHSFREDSSFFTWIYRIVLNVANDYMKKKEKLPVQSLEAAGYIIDESIDHDRISCKEGAHRLKNTSESEALTYLDVDTNNLPDVVTYPQTSKVGVFVKGEYPNFYMQASNVPYCEGES